MLNAGRKNINDFKKILELKKKKKKLERLD